MKTALIFGAGYTAQALIPHLQRAGYRVVATIRDGRRRARLKALGVEVMAFNGFRNTSARAPLLAALKQSDVVLSSVPPNGDTIDPVLSGLGGDYKTLAPKLKWAGYLSATSVYGDRAGGWAFEDERLYPSTARGRARIEAELAWLETGWPVHIFRLAGIYGPSFGPKKLNRNPLERISSGHARAVIKPGHVVNRVHVEDIARAVMASIAAPNPTAVYNVADGNPAPPQEVLAFGAALLSLPPPPEIAYDDEALSPLARSFYNDSKRVDITRARAELGFTPHYPDYRAGLVDLLHAQNPKQVLLAGHIEVPAAHRAAVLAALPAHAALSRAEQDCLRFEVKQDRRDPSVFSVFEAFGSREGFAAHQQRLVGSPWAELTKDCPRDYVTAGLDI